MAMHEPDEVLVTRILVERREEACTDLYSKHRKGAAAVARCFFKSPDLVDAAVNHAFEKAFRHLATWDARRKSFPAWFSRIVKNTCIDLYRKRKSENGRFRGLTQVRHAYLLPELFPDNPCEHHSPHWFNPDVRTFIRDYLGRMGRERVRLIVDPPQVRLADHLRARQTRDRHEIAAPLQIDVVGRELSRRITNELLLASYCGKLPGGLIQ